MKFILDLPYVDKKVVFSIDNAVIKHEEQKEQTGIRDYWHIVLTMLDSEADAFMLFFKAIRGGFYPFIFENDNVTYEVHSKMDYCPVTHFSNNTNLAAITIETSKTRK
jgi:hypothetical protein